MKKILALIVVLITSYNIGASASRKEIPKKEYKTYSFNKNLMAHIKAYSTNNDISKVLFNIIEVLAMDYGTSMNLSFKTGNEIIKDLELGEKLDLIITDDYDLLLELKTAGFVNFLNVGEIFYDKLVYVRIDDSSSIPEERIQMENSIFFKTYKYDKEIIDTSLSKIPSVLIESTNICKKINSIKTLYKESYKYLIVKSSVAKKCDFKPVAFFDNLYNLYYIVVVVTDNFVSAKETLDYITTHKKIKEIIKQNGYSN
jgi:hypothetical protein